MTSGGCKYARAIFEDSLSLAVMYQCIYLVINGERKVVQTWREW